MSIDKEAFHFDQSCSLRKGLKKFGQKGRDAAYKKLKQLHDRVVFETIRIEDLTEIEKRRAMESLIFLVEKRDKGIKGRACANGSSQREYLMLKCCMRFLELAFPSLSMYSRCKLPHLMSNSRFIPLNDYAPSFIQI